MPTEPDNNIEEQLTAWARQRRDEAGGAFELHPATRKLLQDEVARTLAKPKEKNEKTSGWLALLRPQIAFALCVVATVIVVGVFLLPAPSKSKSMSESLVASAGKSERESSDKLTENRRQGIAAPLASPLSSSSSRDDKKVADVETQVPALAADSSARSFSRTDQTADAAKLADARAKNEVASSELAQRQIGREAVKPAFAEKTKEATLAKDESTAAKRTPTGNEARQELVVERSGLKPADGTGPGAAQTRPEARGRGIAVAGPPATPAPTLSRKADALGVPAAGVTVAANGDQAGATELSQGKQVQLTVAVEGKAVIAADPKSQPVPAQENQFAAAEADRGQVTNTLAYFTDSAGQAGQRFSKVARYRRNFNSPPMPAVLTTFQLEQNGQQLRIVDADGSVYEGAFDLAAQNPPGSVATAEESVGELKKTAVAQSSLQLERAAPVNGVAAANQASAFRVTGTNRTLNQLVVFTGNFLAVTNSPPTSVAGVNQAERENLLRQTVNQSQLATNTLQQTPARVQGQATIGDDHRIEIDAVTGTP